MGIALLNSYDSLRIGRGNREDALSFLDKFQQVISSPARPNEMIAARGRSVPKEEESEEQNAYTTESHTLYDRPSNPGSVAFDFQLDVLYTCWRMSGPTRSRN